MIARSHRREPSAIPRLLVEQAILSILLSGLFGALLLVTDTQGLGTLITASHHSGTAFVVVLGTMTSLAPIIMATQIWSLGKTNS